MTLGLFLWMILFLVLNSDMGHFIIYGVDFIICVIISIVIAKKEAKEDAKKDKRINRMK